MIKWLLTTCFYLFITSLFAQNYSIKASVLLSVETNQSPPMIKLKWAAEPDATSYSVFRKLKGASSWGAVRATLPKDSTSYTDSSVEINKAYEYRVKQKQYVNSWVWLCLCVNCFTRNGMEWHRPLAYR
ncbi:MAG: hypothetical protein IPM34_02710 [Saprospiraceae bacterium]|nr:hypothetical protein [Saprospiraceae bacterium]